MYVIIGTTGEWEDRTRWLVAVVNGLDLAEKYIHALNMRYRSIPDMDPMNFDRWREYMDHMSPLDPKFQLDYNGTSYYYEEVDYKDALEEMNV